MIVNGKRDVMKMPERKSRSVILLGALARPGSPDLNPVERFWAWLRTALRQLDLQDAVAKRPVLGKAAYKERIKRICKSKRAQRVAVNIAGGLKKVCLEVVANKGAASRG